MEFAPEFFYGEEREGFYVQPLMKRAWAAQLEVLHEIDKICKRNNIKYFAQWGTLLGAVRHQGFIPWDDDLDIAMLRMDYERFKQIARKELPQGWRLIDLNDDGFDELMLRVVNSNNITLEREFLEQFHGFPYVTGVDIFCMDRIPKNKEEERILLELMNVTDVMGVYWNDYELDAEGRAETIKEIEELTGYHFDSERPLKKQLLYLADKIAAMYWDAESDYYTFMYFLKHSPHYRIPNAVFDKIIEIPFENTTIPVPEDYDLILKCNYGENYMTPIMQRGGHDYPFFRSQIGELREFYKKYGKELPPYFDMDLEE